MPATAHQHFQEDIARARAIVSHAEPLPTATATEQMLRSDLLRSAWMFAVGALDAYSCDAYTDIVAATIISKSRHDPMILPDFFYDIKFPVRAILEPYARQRELEMEDGGQEDDGACERSQFRPDEKFV